MSSSFGKSWGNAWGSSFGRITIVFYPGILQVSGLLSRSLTYTSSIRSNISISEHPQNILIEGRPLTTLYNTHVKSVSTVTSRDSLINRVPTDKQISVGSKKIVLADNRATNSTTRPNYIFNLHGGTTLNIASVATLHYTYNNTVMYYNYASVKTINHCSRESIPYLLRSINRSILGVR